jgi:prevent-host-death family protein
MKKWQFQIAKNKLSEVIDLAVSEGPQTINRRGKDEAVVISYVEFKKLTKPKKSLIDFFADSPLKGVELDLARSQDSGRIIKF